MKPLFEGFVSKVKNVAREEKLQLLVCKYLKLQYPHVIFICDIAAGLNLGKKWAGVTKASRSSRGLPDIYIFHQKFGVSINYCGLAIECKSGKESIYKKDGALKKQKATRKNSKGQIVEEFDHLAEQASALTKLRAQGWKAEFGEGFDQIRKLIDEYLKGN